MTIVFFSGVDCNNFRFQLETQGQFHRAAVTLQHFLTLPSWAATPRLLCAVPCNTSALVCCMCRCRYFHFARSVEVEQPAEAKDHGCMPLLSVCLGFWAEKWKEKKFQQHGSMNLTIEELDGQKTEGSNLKFNNFYGFSASHDSSICISKIAVLLSNAIEQLFIHPFFSDFAAIWDFKISYLMKLSN